ncbi:hypothetical protein M9H77_13967 [Catharanthus roseus]|uniref:Uncharacterized protein n=1 Tax=Catharanthus roseus TaxID=4058 RepID=A0ACC0BLY2_CATRO|nr:hypothetical protein M9H77_13967 [Catharanthus roseus]
MVKETGRAWRVRFPCTYLGLAMELYPQKILVAVVLGAFMPDSDHPPSYPLNKFFEWYPMESMMDTQFIDYGSLEQPGTSMLFGPQLISFKLYRNCSAEDIELAKFLIRPSSLFLQDLSKAKNFSKEMFGSVKRAYILCNEDKVFPVEFQIWMAENIGAVDIKEIKDADLMAMLSKPQQLSMCLLDIAQTRT